MENQTENTQAGPLCSGDLLAEVLSYRRGKGKYNFSRLNENDRANAAYDAWCELENRIEQHLLANTGGEPHGR